MKTNESKWQKFFAGWLRRPSIIDEVIPEDARDEQSKPPVSPLDRIREHLHSHGLGQQVQVRCETAGSGFVLEDDDGHVHAKDYAAAVVMIKRIWLYQPTTGKA